MFSNEKKKRNVIVKYRFGLLEFCDFCLIQLTFNQNFWIFGYMVCAQDIHTKEIK